MTRLIRAVGLVFGSVIGYQIADVVGREFLHGAAAHWARLGAPALGIGVGALIGWAVAPWVRTQFVNAMTWVLHSLGSVPLRDVLAAATGLILGLVIAFLVSIPLLRVPIICPYIIPLAAVLVFGFLWLRRGMQRR